jgi:hypothetical protein
MHLCRRAKLAKAKAPSNILLEHDSMTAYMKRWEDKFVDLSKTMGLSDVPRSAWKATYDQKVEGMNKKQFQAMETKFRKVWKQTSALLNEFSGDQFGFEFSDPDGVTARNCYVNLEITEHYSNIMRYAQDILTFIDMSLENGVANAFVDHENGAAF